MELTHVNQNGEARMVDVGEKAVTLREATAVGHVVMQPETLQILLDGTAPKGDVFAAARIAGIMATKRTHELIPLCHPVPIDGVEVTLCAEPPQRVCITASVRCEYRTGVEMEALTAVSVAALTVYDMLKAADRGMTIADVHLLHKSGGRSGAFTRVNL